MGPVHFLVDNYGRYTRATLLQAAGFDPHRLHNLKFKVHFAASSSRFRAHSVTF